MTFSQSLIVADGTLKLDYASLIFVDPDGIQIDLILLPQLLPAIFKVSGSSYLSKTMAERTQNASLQHSYFTI